MNAYRGSRGIPPFILNLGATVVNITLQPFYSLRESGYRLNRRLGGPQKGSGPFVGKKNFYRASNPGPSIISVVSEPTTFWEVKVHLAFLHSTQTRM